jgi:hypothetical protein
MSSQLASDGPVLDYLNDPAVAAYFAAREHEAYYRSLKSVDERRAFHDDLKATLVRLLEFADARPQVVLDEIIARSVHAASEQVASPLDHVRRVEPEGVQLLGLDGGLDFDRLRTAYRQAALRHHPDRGGSNETMAAINHAYEQLHTLLVDRGVHEGGLMLPAWGIEAQGSLDYLWSATRLLFEFALDDWALDEASIWLDSLVSHAFAGSAFGEADRQRIDLIEPAAKLAERLIAAKDQTSAEGALAVARAGLEKAKARGLLYDPYVAKAEDVVAGRRKPRFVLNHIRQLENARRLGAVDETRYESNLGRLGERRAAKDAARVDQEELLRTVSFVAELPVDSGLRLGAENRTLVPQPGYYEVHVEDLAADQQAEYVLAFGSTPELGHVQKYAFVRLSSLVRSAISFPDAVDPGMLSSEALVLSKLEPRCAWVAHRVAQVLGYFQALDDRRRRAYADELRELLEPERIGSGFVIIVMPGARELAGSFLESAEQRGRRLIESG